MERSPMRIGVLTSSRADFGIYQPLLDKLVGNSDRIKTDLIVFGTHLSHHHGYTLNNIVENYSLPMHKVYGMPLSDTPEAVANAYGTLVSSFSKFWANSSYDWVFALGDRYEMSAAVQGGIPTRIRFAHLHGGETTLGAIDNIYRHQISLASELHFVSTDIFAERVKEITHSDKVYTVGALSLDGIDQLAIPEWNKVKDLFHLPDGDFILCTFHPETMQYSKNADYVNIVSNVLSDISQELSIVITLPNADTEGTRYRDTFNRLKNEFSDKIFLVENFGRLNYFSAVKSSRLLLGNTSSGIVEAASFGKFVINVGDRQKGRPQSPNTFNVPFDEKGIKTNISKVLKLGDYIGENIYHKSGTADQIINILTSA